MCVWFLSREKTRNPRARDRETNPWRDRSGEVLFVDGRGLGSMTTRTLRVLTGAEPSESIGDANDPSPGSDIGRVVNAYRRWRGESAPKWWDEAAHGAWAYADEPGFCRSATLGDIAEQGFVLTPGRYVGAAPVAEDGEPFEERFPRMVAGLDIRFAEGERLTAEVRQQLAAVQGEVADGR